MNCFLFLRIVRSSLSLSALLLILVIGERVNLIRADCPSDDEEGELLLVAMVSDLDAKVICDFVNKTKTVPSIQFV